MEELSLVSGNYAKRIGGCGCQSGPLEEEQGRTGPFVVKECNGEGIAN